jgi:DNA-binding MarR family transcriptional regulator
MTNENEILNKLVVEEKDVTKEMEKLVEEATKYFKIERHSGRILFQDFGSLSDKQRISIIILGKYFANKLGIINNASMSISEIANDLGRPMTALSGPIKELVTKGFVESLPARKYRIAYHRINEIFNNIIAGKKAK